MVSRGSKVSRGQPIAAVGLTGLTEFPHVHFTVRKGNTVIDPFSGDSQVAACVPRNAVETLWSKSAESALMYPGPQIYHLGFANKNPDPADVRDGLHAANTFSTDEPALVFWVEVFSLNAGDVITVSLMGPDGDIVADNQITITRPQARRFAAIGRKKRGAGWPPGTYTGTIEIMRNGIAVQRRTTATVGSE